MLSINDGPLDECEEELLKVELSEWEEPDEGEERPDECSTDCSWLCSVSER